MSKFARDVEQSETPAVPSTPGMVSAEALAEAFSKGFEAAMSRVQAQHAAEMKEIVQAARNRRPESYSGDFEFPNVSAYNADGDTSPRPALKCEMWLGAWDADANNGVRKYPYEWDCLTKREIRLLNQLEPGVFEVRRTDGGRGTVRVVLEKDANGKAHRLTIAFPIEWIEKQSQFVNMLPSITALCGQILGFKVLDEDLIDAWLDKQEKVSA